MVSMAIPGHGWAVAKGKSKRKVVSDDFENEYFIAPRWNCLCSVHDVPKWHFKVGLSLATNNRSQE